MITNRQRGVDCGMWVIRRMDHLSCNVQASLLVSENMRYYRRRTMLEICRKMPVEKLHPNKKRAMLHAWDSTHANDHM